VAYELEINGERHSVDAPGLRPLARVLREDLGLTGTKTGCSEGRCGSCTVIVDGRSVVSCLFPLALAAGSSIRTVEGLAPDDEHLSPLQAALLDAGGVQCGISTPGVLMTLTWLLEQNTDPSEEEIRAALAGNVCRCTGYQKIVEAVLSLRGAAAS
jgi:aerobic-type carbon monoxide dehydrogenase small subunit (CoxS/CutS family)